MKAWMSLMSVLLGASIALAQKPQQAFTISIRTGQTLVTSESPIEVQVTLKNTSDHGFRLFIDKSGKAELSGEQAPRERVAKADKEFVIVTSGGTPMVAPGGTWELHTDVAKLYDLSKPGTYTIQVARTDPADGILVKSNPLKITVTE